MFEVKDTTEAHIEHVAKNARQSDIEEMETFFTEMDMVSMLRGSVKVSDASFTWMIDGEPAAICGICRGNDGGETAGIPWMIGTELLERNPKVLIKASRMFFDLWLLEHGKLTNFVPSNSHKTINYLEHLGFSVTNVGVVPETGKPISLFVAEVNHV